MIFLDLDGVLADFVTAACNIHRRPFYKALEWDFFKEWGYNDDQFWDPINNLGKNFYQFHVHPYPWAYALWNEVRATGEEVVILTNSSDNGPGMVGKMAWIQNHLAGIKGNEVIFCAKKHLLARPDRLLIDDNEKNIMDFEAAGGRGILFPRPWNSNHELADDPLSFLKSKLYPSEVSL